MLPTAPSLFVASWLGLASWLGGLIVPASRAAQDMSSVIATTTTTTTTTTTSTTTTQDMTSVIAAAHVDIGVVDLLRTFRRVSSGIALCRGSCRAPLVECQRGR